MGYFACGEAVDSDFHELVLSLGDLSNLIDAASNEGLC
jgi:hypothetical protein